MFYRKSLSRCTPCSTSHRSPDELTHSSLLSLEPDSHSIISIVFIVFYENLSVDQVAQVALVCVLDGPGSCAGFPNGWFGGTGCTDGPGGPGGPVAMMALVPSKYLFLPH